MAIQKCEAIDNSIEMMVTETLIRFESVSWEDRANGAHGIKMIEVQNPAATSSTEYNALVIFSPSNGFIKSIELLDDRDRYLPKRSASNVEITFTMNLNEAIQVESLPSTLRFHHDFPNDIDQVYLRGTFSSSKLSSYEAYPALEAIEKLLAQFEVSIAG